MSTSLTWMLIGALIGVVCWQRKGLNPALAIIGGILLGPLAFLMLFASPGGSGTRKCPHCASWITKEAKVCPRCQRDIPLPLGPQASAAAGPSYGRGMKR